MTPPRSQPYVRASDDHSVPHVLPARSSAAAPRILLVGSIPRPVGGVTQHVWRLATRLTPLQPAVLDLHPGPHEKYPVPLVPVHLAPGWRAARFPWLLKKLHESPAEVVHLHFSGPRLLAWSGTWLRTACRQKRLVLTLHHGDQARLVNSMNRRLRSRLRDCLAACDTILCLSEQQQELYRDTLDIPDHQLCRATSYLTVPAPTLKEVALRGSYESQTTQEVLLVASGYADPSYRHEWGLQLFDRLRRSCRVRFVLCLYGQVRDAGYLAWLRAEANKRPAVELHFGMDFLDFLMLQSRAALYLRPTQIDSCGIAVWDAVSLGTPVVASDVCERPRGCLTFPSAHYEAFEAAALHALHDRRPRQAQVLPDSLDVILRAYGMTGGDGMSEGHGEQEIRPVARPQAA